MVADRSRRTPRIGNRLLRRVRDYAQVMAGGAMDESVVNRALDNLEIDALGLDETDRRTLKTLIDKFNGGPVGLTTLAAATAEEVETLEDVIEPFLLRLGLIARTPRGRMATELAYKHLGFTPPERQGTLVP
jgi:Holliday junction DNA helicase RuvB